MQDVKQHWLLRGLVFVLWSLRSSIDSVAMMPCNPNVGGSSKGHLVREIDALGGEMGKNIDKTYIQSKMLNMSKDLQFILCVHRQIRRITAGQCVWFWKIQII